MSDKEIKQATEKVIKEMLTESTGKALMDSGDAYGRHWERNQKDGIKQGKQPCYNFSNNDTLETELTPIIPIFDYLSKTVEYTEECQMLEKLLPNLNYTDLYYIEDIIKNPKNYSKKLQVFESNRYWGSEVENTYNYEDVLSQGFQYIWFEYDADEYIAISIHNGCDIRGGYTDIHIFKVEWSEEMWGAKNQANVYCKCGMHDYRETNNTLEYWKIETEVNQKYIYAHSYTDKNGNLRCKYCNEIICCEAIDI